ncbi:hypothetical protein GCM10018952_19000 [Streptosporangium vulgare]
MSTPKASRRNRRSSIAAPRQASMVRASSGSPTHTSTITREAGITDARNAKQARP